MTNLLFTKQNSFNETDRISCILVGYGKVITTFSISGVRDIKDVYRRVKSEAKDTKGLLTLNLRNMTQGWSDRYALNLR